MVGKIVSWLLDSMPEPILVCVRVWCILGERVPLVCCPSNCAVKSPISYILIPFHSGYTHLGVLVMHTSQIGAPAGSYV